MNEQPKPEASQPGDPAPVPDGTLDAEREVGEVGPHGGPSEAATADIEERQKTRQTSERDKGRSVADAPSY